MKATLSRVCLLGMLVVCAGCRDKEDERLADRARVAATSQADATADVTDEELGFALRHPGPGWKLFHRDDAAAFSRGAVAAALSPRDVVGAVHLSRLDGGVRDHVERLTAKMPMANRELVVGAKDDDAGGQAMFFDVKGSLGGVPIVYSGKAVARGGLVYDVVAWSPAQGAASSESDAKAFVDAFELRDQAPSPDAITAATSDGGARIGDDFSIRARKYRDFRLALTVAPPEGLSMSAGAEARAAHPDARLLLRQPEKGLVALLTSKPPPEGDGRTLHEQLLGAARKAVALEPGPARTAKLGDAEALVTDGSATVEGEATHYRLSSTVHGEHGLALWIWGSPEAMQANAELLDGLNASIDLQIALPAVEATTAAYSDHRLGFTVTTPSGWAREELTPTTLESRGTLVRWENDGRWIAVVAAALPGTASRHPWMVSFLEQLLRDELGGVTRATASRRDDELGGQPATRVSWHAPLQSVDALLAHHDGIAYAVLTVDHDTTSYDLAKRSFAFLP